MTGMISKALMAAAIISTATAAQAAVTASESFDYNIGTALGGANGGSGWAGAWVTGSSATPTYDTIAQSITPPAGYGTPIGNQGFINPNATADDSGGATPDIRRDLANTIDMDVAQTVYFSALIRREDATNGGGTEHSQYLRFNSTTGTRLIGLGNSSSEDFRLALNNTDYDSATVDFQIGVDYLVVGKMTLNPAGTNDILEGHLFTSGDVLAEPGVWHHSTSDDVSGIISQLQLNPQRRAGKVFIDEIRIGETFADVTTVPEPISSSLLGIGGLALMYNRRNRG